MNQGRACSNFKPRTSNWLSGFHQCHQPVALVPAPLADLAHFLAHILHVHLIARAVQVHERHGPVACAPPTAQPSTAHPSAAPAPNPASPSAARPCPPAPPPDPTPASPPGVARSAAPARTAIGEDVAPAVPDSVTRNATCRAVVFAAKAYVAVVAPTVESVPRLTQAARILQPILHLDRLRRDERRRHHRHAPQQLRDPRQPRVDQACLYCRSPDIAPAPPDTPALRPSASSTNNWSAYTPSERTSEPVRAPSPVETTPGLSGHSAAARPPEPSFTPTQSAPRHAASANSRPVYAAPGTDNSRSTEPSPHQMSRPGQPPYPRDTPRTRSHTPRYTAAPLGVYLRLQHARSPPPSDRLPNRSTTQPTRLAVSRREVAAPAKHERHQRHPPQCRTGPPESSSHQSCMRRPMLFSSGRPPPGTGIAPPDGSGSAVVHRSPPQSPAPTSSSRRTWRGSRSPPSRGTGD